MFWELVSKHVGRVCLLVAFVYKVKVPLATVIQGPSCRRLDRMRTSAAATSPSRKDAAARRALGEQRATATVQQVSALKDSVRRVVRCRIVRSEDARCGGQCGEG